MLLFVMLGFPLYFHFFFILVAVVFGPSLGSFSWSLAASDLATPAVAYPVKFMLRVCCVRPLAVLPESFDSLPTSRQLLSSLALYLSSHGSKAYLLLLSGAFMPVRELERIPWVEMQQFSCGDERSTFVWPLRPQTTAQFRRAPPHLLPRSHRLLLQRLAFSSASDIISKQTTTMPSGSFLACRTLQARTGEPFSRLPTSDELMCLLPVSAYHLGLKVYLMLYYGHYTRLRKNEDVAWDKLARVTVPGTAISCFFLRVAYETPGTTNIPDVQEVVAAVSSSELSPDDLQGRLDGLPSKRNPTYGM
jgi:hypothetical protein